VITEANLRRPGPRGRTVHPARAAPALRSSSVTCAHVTASGLWWIWSQAYSGG